MSWSFLSFLGEPWFVIPWYAVGAAGAAWIVHDTRTSNTALKPAIRWAWPIIVFFFSVLGLGLYLSTARAPGIGKISDPGRKKDAHDRYERAMWRRVNGAVIHCVAGDGFGIMTAMVIARAGGLGFWQEFWFEYAVGFAIGWLIFQRKSMTSMTDSLAKQLAMAFRGEFFSMLTVMGGMGAVMTWVTPVVVTAQPKPLTFAFWGFGMLGLLVGYVFTWPMNFLLVKVGWKHGMGGMEAAKKHELGAPGAKLAAVAGMVLLGAGALFVVQWLTEVRESAGHRGERAIVVPRPGASPGEALHDGVMATLARAVDGLQTGDRREATTAMDAASRAADVGAYSAPGSFYVASTRLHDAHIALQEGNDGRALRLLEQASSVVEPAGSARPPILELHAYAGATVIDPTGAIIGEVTHAGPDGVELAIGGWRDAWGFVDFGPSRYLRVPVSALAFGPPRTVGLTLVAVPTGTRTTVSRGGP